MSQQNFDQILINELQRIDSSGSSKRDEFVIQGFTDHENPRAISDGKEYQIFDSNDYLGLRFHPALLEGEHQASKKFGTGPGAVRFISGTASIYPELEEAIAHFHGRKTAMVLSSAYQTNVGVIQSLIKGQAGNSLVSGQTLVLSDELNHRSIIDGIRVANLPREQRPIYKHFNFEDVRRLLEENTGKYERALVITDGVFSMLGEYTDLKKLRNVIDEFQEQYEKGVFLFVDDSHGVGAFGQTGRGNEEVAGAQADFLVGTFGKAFGADGGYVVVQTEAALEYFREAIPTYIYSNPPSPGTAGAALAAVKLIDSQEGKNRLAQLRTNIELFKKSIRQSGFTFAADSIHPIQPVLIGDTVKTAQLKKKLKEMGYKVTNISYPVVPQGRDEIRIQISAIQSQDDIKDFVDAFTLAGKDLGLL